MGKFSINLVNPIIIRSYDLMEFYNDGCLSFPGIYINTKRFNEILVKDMINPAGIICTGIEAVVIQHEIDHTNGITMFDREIKIPQVNEKCWCGSTKKYKLCHKNKIIKS